MELLPHRVLLLLWLNLCAYIRLKYTLLMHSKSCFVRLNMSNIFLPRHVRPTKKCSRLPHPPQRRVPSTLWIHRSCSVSSRAPLPKRCSQLQSRFWSSGMELLQLGLSVKKLLSVRWELWCDRCQNSGPRQDWPQVCSLQLARLTVLDQVQYF